MRFGLVPASENIFPNQISNDHDKVSNIRSRHPDDPHSEEIADEKLPRNLAAVSLFHSQFFDSMDDLGAVSMDEMHHGSAEVL